MADHELTYEEALQGLNELFGSTEAAAPARSFRKYVLEYQDGEPTFQPVPPRSELDVIFDEVVSELFGPDTDGDEIVPLKLAKLFPGSLNSRAAS